MTISRSNPRFHICDQGTPEWFEFRRGIPTASNYHKVFTEGGRPSKNKNGEWSAQAKEFLAKLVTERILDESIEEKVLNTYWVEWGKLQEPVAIKKFQDKFKLVLERVNFITTGDGKIGCSPDCMVKGSCVPVEIKCPAPHTRMFYSLFGLGERYKPQVMGQMLVTNTEEAHFFSYHPRMPDYYLHTKADKQYINDLADTLDEFCDELDEAEKYARSLGDYMGKDEWMRQVDDGTIVFPGAFPWRDKA